jgi:hypothetical protein
LHEVIDRLVNVLLSNPVHCDHTRSMNRTASSAASGAKVTP